MNNINKILWGIIFVILGIIIGLNSFGITDINIFFKGWWTLFIIIPCTVDLFSEKTEKKGNIIGIIIGVILLLACNGLINIEIIAKLTIPVILVILGLSLIFNSTIKKEVADKIKSKNKNNLETVTAAFSEQKIDKDNEAFSGIVLDSVFGSIKLDLRKAELHKESVIKASAIFGGIDILVPKNVDVKVKGTPIFGSISNKITNDKENKKTIYVEAFSMFGGVDIK